MASKFSYRRLEMVLVLLGLLIAILAWRYPHLPAGTVTETRESGEDHLRHGDDLVDLSKEAQSVAEGLPSDLSTRRTGLELPSSSSTPLPAPEFPAEVALRDGEQSVLLTGRASVGIQFNQLGSERFLTLHVNAEDGDRSHTMLGTGTRFPFRVAGVTYQVSLLVADYDERTARLRIDRTN